MKENSLWPVAASEFSGVPGFKNPALLQVTEKVLGLGLLVSKIGIVIQML